jgi:hypothetical protein
MVFSFFLMVDNNSIMAHYDAGNKGEETISSSYDRLLDLLVAE